jgi:hypothetical protein
VAEDTRGVAGLLPMCWIEESGKFGYFPGEVWDGKTWLEQNRIILRRGGLLPQLLGRCPGPYHLRYLVEWSFEPAAEGEVDEIGYLFLPPKYGYDIENYYQEFSHRSAKRLRKDLAEYDRLGVSFRYDEIADFDLIVSMNIGRFGDKSYFHDPRFTDSFRCVAHYLRDRGMLRMTAVIINGEPAAVDMGCVYRGVYTLLGGGTHPGYPGVAKIINVHHMERGCRERFQVVDFLCGDFLWKKLFHLTPSPLYLLTNIHPAPVAACDAHAGSAPGV